MWTTFFPLAVHLYLLCLIDQRYRYLLSFTLPLARFCLANSKLSAVIKHSKTRDSLKNQNHTHNQNRNKPQTNKTKPNWGSFQLTSGFWVFLEDEFPPHPRERESDFLSDDSRCCLANNETSVTCLWLVVFTFAL